LKEPPVRGTRNNQQQEEQQQQHLEIFGSSVLSLLGGSGCKKSLVCSDGVELLSQPLATFGIFVYFEGCGRRQRSHLATPPTAATTKDNYLTENICLITTKQCKTF